MARAARECALRRMFSHALVWFRLTDVERVRTVREMKLFLSYASQDRAAAMAIETALRESGHDVFFDRDDLPPGEEFHTRIRQAIAQSDLLIFLLSPDSVDAGSYTLTELEIAESAWKRASGKLLPVLLRPTPLDSLPPFLKSVTFLETSGNVAAAVDAAVARLAKLRRQRALRRVGVPLAIALFAVVSIWRFALPPYSTGNGKRADSTGLQQSVAGPDSSNTAVASIATGADGAPMLLVPAGTFTMGDDENSPRREVFLDSFYIDQYEITTGRYAKFLAATGSTRTPDDWETLNAASGADLPVVGVDWNDADAYCRWAGRRLPTDSEWEKAARGSDARRYPWGDESPSLARANYDNASPAVYEGGLTDVGKHPAGRSPYGVDDLAGNAAEWTHDWFSESFPASAVRNPRGPESGDQKTIRGGGRFDSGDRISPTKRYHASPETRGRDIGFRCARDVR
jgi:formylglycine-generating enzyme required for sulfatase activity